VHIFPIARETVSVQSFFYIHIIRKTFGNRIKAIDGRLSCNKKSGALCTAHIHDNLAIYLSQLFRQLVIHLLCYSEIA
jgi:hypothetical protein